MIRQSATLLAALSLAACLDGQNPLVATDPVPADPNALDLPPGTERPTSRTPVERHEEEDGTGNGYAQSIAYNAGSDTFTVDNLAFDGGNTYSRARDSGGNELSLNSFRVYENDGTYADDVTGTPIPQFMHRAIIAEGASGGTRVAIVRTGAYVGYGFGGFLYSRDGGVELPATGQALFSGDYAGIRDFNGKGGLEYTTGDAEAAIDFEDFNSGNGVRLRITNRHILDSDGNDITASLIAAIGLPWTQYPDLLPGVGPSMTDAAGEMKLNMATNYYDLGGNITSLETGTYYGLLSGAGANMELVGVVIVEGTDPRDGFGYRETGGFVMERH